jgi:hypothetical protein
MGTDHPPRDKQAHRAKPSLWAAEPIDDSLSLLENALREDEPSLWDGERTDDVNSPLRRLPGFPGLLVQPSDLIRKNVVHAR